MGDRRGGTDTTASGRAFRESRPGERSCGHPAAGDGRPLQRSVTGWDGRGPVTPMPGPALPRATPPPALRFPCHNTDNARSRLHVGWRATTSGGYQRAKRVQEGGRAPFLISWRRRMGIEPRRRRMLARVRVRSLRSNAAYGSRGGPLGLSSSLRALALRSRSRGWGYAVSHPSIPMLSPVQRAKPASRRLLLPVSLFPRLSVSIPLAEAHGNRTHRPGG